MSDIVVARSTAPVPYLDGWDGWTGVQNRFQMDERRPEEVLAARYTQDGCEGSAYVLYRNGGSYFYASGSHCSCFGLEDQWAPEEYSLEILVGALERADGETYGFCGEDATVLLPIMRKRLTKRLARDRAKDRLLAA